MSHRLRSHRPARRAESNAAGWSKSGNQENLVNLKAGGARSGPDLTLYINQQSDIVTFPWQRRLGIRPEGKIAVVVNAGERRGEGIGAGCAQRCVGSGTNLPASVEQATAQWTARTAPEHLASLCDGRAVYIDGVRVVGVTTHPSSATQFESAAALYDFQAQADNVERLTFEPSGGQRRSTAAGKAT